MAGFTKLFSSILTSSVWQEDDKTRLLWITMLASADADGRVEAAIPGLAMLARISIEECEHALELLLSPDEYSRTTEHEGRRIEVIDGGWLVLNYRKYRDSGRPASRAPYYRKRRAEKKRNSGATVAQQEAENAQHPGVARNTRATSRIKRIAGAEAEADLKELNTPPATPTEDEIVSRIIAGIGEAHQAAFGSALPSRWKDAVRKACKKGDGTWLAKIDADAMREAKARCKPPMRWGLGTVQVYLEESCSGKPNGREIVDRETLTCEQCGLTIEVLKHADGKASRTGPEPCEHLKEKGRDWFNARK
ncbi:MAG TPA: hypothetical protein VMY35_03885 [Phycisphaerae bacterium]|nr:hypothetical protein [Phycisphaerae bacterium]